MAKRPKYPFFFLSFSHPHCISPQPVPNPSPRDCCEQGRCLAGSYGSAWPAAAAARAPRFGHGARARGVVQGQELFSSQIIYIKYHLSSSYSNFFGFFIHTITIFKVWTNAITIRLLRNIPLQFFASHKNDTEYVWRQPGPSCMCI